MIALMLDIHKRLEDERQN